jgi:predicted outer membrane repeat protein
MWLVNFPTSKNDIIHYTWEVDMKSLFIVMIIVLVTASFSSADIINVPGDSATIQGAITGALDGDTVLVAHGTYPENIDFTGKKITVGSLFLTTGDTTHISQTTIDGGGQAVNQSVVSFLGGEDSLSVLAGFTISNGYCSDSHGGGMTITGGAHPHIEDCRIVNNSGPTSSVRGVGIRCTASSPTIRRCLIGNNTPIGNGNFDHYGAGIYLSALAAPNFEDCKIINNLLLQGIYHRNYGGGLYCDASWPTFTNCEISGNTADYGGGIEAVNSSNVTFQHCTFDSNSVRHTGGAIHSGTASVVQVDSCLFIKNTAQQNGGALYTREGGHINAVGSTITDNRAGDDFEGLGAGAYAEPGTSPTLTDCIVFYNWASEIYPSDLSSISYCDVRGGYTGSGNIDYDPFFCDWANGDYHLASNSLCVTAGSGSGLIGRYGVGCTDVYPRTIRVPQDTSLIQEAIFASYQGDTVLVDVGFYSENVNIWGRRILLTSNYIHSGDTSDVINTIIDGGGATANQSGFYSVGGEDSLSVLSGFTITNGYCSGSHGGGITIKNNAHPHIEDCRIVNNSGPTSSVRGVGIYCTASSPTIRRCLIGNNTPTGNGNFDHYGAGIYLSALAAPKFEDCKIINNLLLQGIYHRNYGGGLYCDDSWPTFINCEISGNTADYGGGIEAVNSSNVTFQNCTFDSNSVRHTGGAIHSGTASVVQVDSCLFIKNTAQQNGGALYTREGGHINAVGSTITDNRAGDDFEGLGAGAYAEPGTSPTLTDCIVFYNWASEIYPSDLSSISYCDVRGGYTGSGNIDYDPFFCDWANGDYHLASNSLCVTAGSGSGLIGRYGVGCTDVYPRTIRVPQDTSLIQEAIFASYQGDTVLVDVGSYPENINFWGRRVLLSSHYIHSRDTSDISHTIIDGGDSTANQSGVSFIGNEDSLSILCGFSITNGWASESHGGGITLKNGSRSTIQNCWIFNNSGPRQAAKGVGIYCSASSPSFDDCLIQNNAITSNGNYDHFGGGVYIASSAAPNFNNCDILDNQIAFGIYHRNYGGGVYCNNSSPVFHNCSFSGNTSDYGAGIELVNSPNAIIQNNYFSYNSARNGGGAIYMSHSDPLIINNTISRNSAGSNGGGIYCEHTSPTIMNTILWENMAASGPEIDSVSCTPSVSYSDVQGGWIGTGNIDVDPAFEDTIYFHLSDTSQCIDAGNPDPAYNDPEDPTNLGFALWPAKGTVRNDMGAFGGPRTVDWITSIADEPSLAQEIPTGFQLLQNYPNPFNPITTITFSLPRTEFVTLKIYNILGQEVIKLIDEPKSVGTHYVKFDASALSSGVYFYRLDVGGRRYTKKMVLIK